MNRLPWTMDCRGDWGAGDDDWTRRRFIGGRLEWRLSEAAYRGVMQGVCRRLGGLAGDCNSGGRAWHVHWWG